MLPKILYHLGAERLQSYRWQRGELTPGPHFTACREGMQAFAQHLDTTRTIPAYLVVDLVEEDFQRCLLPHVGGAAGRKLIERRLAQAYRDTPFRHASVQERDQDGRRDDHVLFCALTNPALIQPWIAQMVQQNTPLAGIFSGAFLVELLARKMSLVQPHLLLITEQGGALRQTYFEGPYLRFSRLTVLAEGADAIRCTVSETGRMQQYLSSTRILARDDILQVVVLAPPARMAALDQACEDSEHIAFHLIAQEDGAASADPLLLALLARQAPRTQFSTGAAGQAYQRWRVRLCLNGAAAGIAALAAVWLMADAWAIAQDGRQRDQLLTEAAQFDARYRQEMASQAPPPARSANMRAAVELDRLIGARGPSPGAIMSTVSRALESSPAIRLLALNWEVQQPALPATTVGGDGPAPISAALAGLQGAPPQNLRIDGEIDSAATDYRAIVDSVNRFAAEIGRNPGMTAAIVETPLDLRQNVRLVGKTDNADPGLKPRFAIQLTWRQQ